MSSGFAIRAIPTSQLAAELAQHCAQATPILAQQRKALTSALGRESSLPAALAECRSIHQDKVKALDQQFQRDGRALIKLSDKIARLEKKAESPTSGPARLTAIENLKKIREQKADALLEHWVAADSPGADRALAASKAHEERLIAEHGSIAGVMLRPDWASQMGTQDPRAKTQYYNEQIFWRHSVITQDYDRLVPWGGERLETAQRSYNQNPNDQTHAELLKQEHEMNGLIDDRSHYWMQLKWLSQLRDESAAPAKQGWLE